MKAAIVIFAIASIASASVVVNDISGLELRGVGLSGLGYSGLGYSAVGVAPVAPWAVHSEIVQQNGGVLPVAAALHTPYVAAPVVAAAVPEAVSVTANRGSVHVAPLPGHAVSSSQLNLAPAPGTW